MERVTFETAQQYLRDFAHRFSRQVMWQRPLSPAEHFRKLAQTCEELGVDQWDVYGEGGAVERLEAEISELLGAQAAVLMPSGTMGQQAMLRVWCDDAGRSVVALPDLSHLLTHELDGPRRVSGLDFIHLTTGREAPTAAHLEAIDEPLGAVLIELPLRDAGCVLPTWEELQALSDAAAERGVALHADGARLWESQLYYGRPLAEIADLFDSVYVSLYKVLGATSGAVIVGPREAMGALRTWRKRMGGTLYRLTPLAVGGLLGLRDELPKVESYVLWARCLADQLEEHGIRVTSSLTNTLEVFAEGDAEVVNARLLKIIQRERLIVSPLWRRTTVPGMVTNELAIQAAALEFEPTQVAAWLAEALACGPGE